MATTEIVATPGPWRWEQTSDGYDILSSSPTVSATVAVVCARRSVTGEADARLIAAAPDLLHALKSLADAAGPDGVNLDVWLDCARDAIRRAEGAQ